jgi:hypothetical protein
LSGMELVWSFYSYSPVYETILGLIEVSVGLLVFFKRTTKLGVLLFLPIMINLVLLNLIYNIGALVVAYPLFIAGVILFFINLKSYTNYFFGEGPATVSKSSSFHSIIPKLSVLVIGVGLASLIVYHNKFKIKQDVKINGTWVFANDAKIKRIYFEKGNVCVIKDVKDSLYFGSYQTNQNKTISISEISGALVNWKEEPYSVENNSLLIGMGGKKQLLKKIE